MPEPVQQPPLEPGHWPEPVPGLGLELALELELVLEPEHELAGLDVVEESKMIEQESQVEVHLYQLPKQHAKELPKVDELKTKNFHKN